MVKKSTQIPPPPDDALPPRETCSTLTEDLLNLLHSKEAVDLLDWEEGGLKAHRVIMELQTDQALARVKTLGDLEDVYLNCSSSLLLPLLSSEVNADCSIGIADTEVMKKAHRVILAARSPYHRGLILSHMSTSTTGVYLLSKDVVFSAEILNAFLHYVYADSLPVLSATDVRRLWVLADYLSWQALCQACEWKMYEMLHRYRCVCDDCVRQVRAFMKFADGKNISALLSGTRHILYHGWDRVWMVKNALASLDEPSFNEVLDELLERITPRTVIKFYCRSTELLSRGILTQQDPTCHIEFFLGEIQARALYVLTQNFPAVVAQSKEFAQLLENWQQVDWLEMVLQVVTDTLRDESVLDVWDAFHFGKIRAVAGAKPIITATERADQFLQRRWINIAAVNGFNHLSDEKICLLAEVIGVTPDELKFSANKKKLTTKTGLFKMVDIADSQKGTDDDDKRRPPTRRMGIHPTAPAKEGDVVQLEDGRRGVVRYVGTVEGFKGAWVGIELDTSDGKNDGSLQGKRYFQSRAGHGVFVRPSVVITTK